MSISIKLSKDEISPDLERIKRKVQHAQPVLRAMGTEIVSITKRAFTDSALRQFSWPAKKSGQPATLIKKGMLLSSIRITAIDNRTVTVGSDRKYAAVHQLGSAKKKGRGSGIPARPFFPFSKDGKLASFADRKVRLVVKDKIDRIFV